MSSAPLQSDPASHWQSVYLAKPDHETSWFQLQPSPALELICEAAPTGGTILDVGGGNSVLAGRLAERGYNVTVLDIAPAALERGKAHAGPLANRIRWIAGDITAIDNLGEFDVWHDRAVFHFLMDARQRSRYFDLATRSIKPGGHLIVSTFAMSGPERCSGLPVQRYDAAKLLAEFGGMFELVKSFESTHTTPWGKPQNFLCAVLRRGVSHR